MIHVRLQLTYSQDKIVVRLVVDFIKDVEHFDGEVCDRAQVSRNGFFNLEQKSKKKKKTDTFHFYRLSGS